MVSVGSLFPMNLEEGHLRMVREEVRCGGGESHIVGETCLTKRTEKMETPDFDLLNSLLGKPSSSFKSLSFLQLNKQLEFHDFKFFLF